MEVVILKNAHQIADLVYEYFLMRIRFHYYKYGDTLPTVDTLCREFCIGAETVKAALRRLRAEGYISMRNGQLTKVLFRQSEQEITNFVINYFAERQTAFGDLCKTVELIFIPILAECFRRTSEEEFVHLTPYVERAYSDDILYFYTFVLQKLQNPLAMNLFWETSLFMGLMFIGENGGEDLHNKKILRKSIEKVISCRKAQDWVGLKDALLSHQRDSLEQALQFIEQQIQPAERQTAFVWRIYRDRPQICYTLATRILHESYLGDYRDAEYLPSYEKMAEKYGVCVSTMRRTIHVLNQLGATESVNGVGTRIFTPGKRCHMPNFNNPSVRQNLAYFVQSFELIIYSCEEVALTTFYALSTEELTSLCSQLEENLNTCHTEFSLWHLLICIARSSPFQGVQEIYAKIYGLFLWGYPLKASLEKTQSLDREADRFTQTMLNWLRERDFRRCAKAVKELVARQFPAAEKYLIDHGILHEELRLYPSISLILTDELI